MLIQGEYLLKKKLMNKNWQHRHIGEEPKNSQASYGINQTPLNGKLLSAMSLTNSLALDTYQLTPFAT